MKPSIRTVRNSDLQAVVDIDQTLFGAESFSSFVMRQFFNLFPESFFVAEQDEQLLGYAAIGVQPSSKNAWLISAGVLAPFQNQGVGSALLTACDDYCVNTCVASCRLTTDPDNNYAIHLYEKFGFRKDSELRDYYVPGDRKLLMVKTFGI